MTLSLRLGAKASQHFASRMHANLGAVKHLDTEDIEMFGWTSTYDLGETADANAHQFTTSTFLSLFFAEGVIADPFHRQLQGAGVVAAVVLPVQRRLVRKLLRLNEVLQPKLCWIHPQLMGHHISHSFDRVHGFGDAERTPICNAAGRLIRVDS